MLKIAIIVGSVRPGRAGYDVARWYESKVKTVEGAEFEIVDLADQNLPLLDEAYPAMMAQYEKDHTKAWSKVVDSYDAYVWVSPEYNHAAPASLTNAISFLNKEWNRKPVALVSYGTVGGVRAAEHLRAVAGELHMADIRPQVAILNPWAMKDENGEIKEELVIGDPVEQAQDLLWWANALKNAK